ncbi:class I SAM-dependent methyltransferase [Streptomyces sp. WAC05374]|uniref:class I SAM-dependent methyltransferase n=1 Tax=Streptomyces sp. WAC05374 TaxID=2487420 RepID=UPI000F87DD2A|nr:class I SAM-dependent methyltransferase [Streptomyces sp. WAC05374]RST12848.1 class I SAM-dependent methyltransferase [Streptomyces sp. WAC05374]TDF47012.1 class I SAM-dependent methyltransferase [Streptomyces sp. WAC05374]TDF57267.1 class I SAM-dependent methyltransferase [Streptomyces sp. WAC05374]TDF61370.1 class I SAM-dependent methyltransferase [Streptomyces sp. WAC05374]
MPSLLSNRLAKRVLRPAFALVEQRMERATTALQSDLDALHHAVADLRRQSYGLGLLLDQAGRDGHRMPTATQVDTLVREVRAVTGDGGERARHDITVAYRHLVALEALGAGDLAGTVSDVCGRLTTVPLLAPPNGDVLEIGTRHGLFAAALQRMLRRDGIEARLTIVDPLDGSPTREDVVRGNLVLGGGSGAAEAARLVRGGFGDTAVRERVADRRYGVIVVNGEHDLAAVRELAAPDAVVVLGDQPRPAGLTGLGRVAESVYCRAA